MKGKTLGVVGSEHKSVDFCLVNTGVHSCIHYAVRVHTDYNVQFYSGSLCQLVNTGYTRVRFLAAITSTPGPSPHSES